VLQKEHEIIKSIDKDNDKHTQLLNVSKPENKSKTGGLVGELHLAVGAKVMLSMLMSQTDW
jgi:hypothetical protein